jgi:hypothetical protein
MSSPSELYYEPQPPSQFGYRPVQTCANKIPTVLCQTREDCEKWMDENCTHQDRMAINPICEVSGFCRFPLSGRGPPEWEQ